MDGVWRRREVIWPSTSPAPATRQKRFQTAAPAPSRLAAAVAKPRTGEAALVANRAHALHGAIGMTEVDPGRAEGVVGGLHRPSLV